MMGISRCPGLCFNCNASRNPVCAWSPNLLGWAVLFFCFIQITSPFKLPVDTESPCTAGLLPCPSSSAVFPERGWFPCLGGVGQQRCGMVIAELTANDKCSSSSLLSGFLGSCTGEPGYLFMFLFPTFQCLLRGWGFTVTTPSRATLGVQIRRGIKMSENERRNTGRGEKTGKDNRQNGAEVWCLIWYLFHPKRGKAELHWLLLRSAAPMQVGHWRL